MSAPGRSWVAWAHDLEGLTPTQALVVLELARLADWRGESVCSAAYLAGVTGRCLRSVRLALAGLRARGLVVCRARVRPDGGRASSVHRLVALAAVADPAAARAAPGGGGPGAGAGGRDVAGSGGLISWEDDEGLRAAICRAVDEAWVGEASRLVAASMLVVVGSQFRATVERGRALALMGPQESRWDTASWAWECLRESAEAVMEAESPWALWAEITLRRSSARSLPAPSASGDGSGPLVAGAGLLPGDCAPVEHVGIDDFGDVLGPLVEALVAAGVAEAVAWAGTLRVAELALAGPSRRHTLAAGDPRLADLGASPGCARMWMSLLVGTRRRGEAAGLLGLDASALAARAAEVAEAYRAGPC